MKYLPRFHWRPVVVELPEGVPMGMRPQCGPSTEDWIWISWCSVLGSSWIRQSSDKRTICVVEKWHNVFMFPISWSNLPPSAPATSMHNWKETQNPLQVCRWQKFNAINDFCVMLIDPTYAWFFIIRYDIEYVRNAFM